MTTIHHWTDRLAPAPDTDRFRRRFGPLVRIGCPVVGALLSLLLGRALLHGLMRGDPSLGFADGVLLLFVALRLILRLSRPSTRLVALRRPGDVRRSRPAGAVPPRVRRWYPSAGPPGLLAILQEARLLLVDPSTHYERTELRREDILLVEPVARIFTPRARDRRIHLGLSLGGGLTLSLAPGSRPPSRVRYAVSLGYSVGSDGPARTTLLVCRDAGEARLLAATITDWVAQA